MPYIHSILFTSVVQFPKIRLVSLPNHPMVKSIFLYLILLTISQISNEFKSMNH
jgi:hypothetical protein